MSHLPYLICIGVLAALLLARESQHARITKGLLDKILESKGHDALPSSPVEKLIEDCKEHRAPHPPKVTEEMKKKLEAAKRRIHFPIPGMPVFTEKK